MHDMIIIWKAILPYGAFIRAQYALILFRSWLHFIQKPKKKRKSIWVYAKLDMVYIPHDTSVFHPPSKIVRIPHNNSYHNGMAPIVCPLIRWFEWSFVCLHLNWNPMPWWSQFLLSLCNNIFLKPASSADLWYEWIFRAIADRRVACWRTQCASSHYGCV